MFQLSMFIFCQRMTVIASNPKDNYQRITVIASNPKDNYQRIIVIASNPKDNYQRITVIASNPKDKYQRITVIASNSKDNYQRITVIASNPKDNYQRITFSAYFDPFNRSNQRKLLLGNDLHRSRKKSGGCSEQVTISQGRYVGGCSVKKHKDIVIILFLCL
jgi:hypothetical protein